ncbi:hypothetical protein BZG36_01119 [Bifiguratus adelaidae]|uniref:Saccharopine dehydrogenase NADP binding domain-containing protein n=1 Tax=Bifiguratus adelaidae TaxID=1938954 RepID=A0A261Y614_9FUNG|nr:hypothetical protein BZG36_01119 [Bifiguratus adelaidae]
MSTRYSLVVYGATGAAGQAIALELAHLLAARKDKQVRWALGGRNKDTLKRVQQRIRDETGQVPDLVIARIQRTAELTELCESTLVLINAVGPFRFAGEYVLRACLEAKCHYMDLSDEPEFWYRMHRIYHERLASSKLLAVLGCGGYPMLCNVAPLLLQHPKCSTAPSVDLSDVRMYLSPLQTIPFLDPVLTPTRYESIVHSFAALPMLSTYTDDSDAKMKARDKGRHPRRADTALRHAVRARGPVQHLQHFAEYLALHTPSTDPPNHTTLSSIYYVCPSWFAKLLTLCLMWLFSILTLMPWGRSILNMYADKLCKRQDAVAFATNDDADDIFSLRIVPNPDVSKSPSISPGVIVLRGPHSSYSITAPLVAHSAQRLLDKMDKDQSIPHGVVTPAILFDASFTLEVLKASAIDISF